MNYETAKKLKENGFPIKDRTFSVECECNHEDITLSELIEACGRPFRRLRKVIDARDQCARWQATGKKGKDAGITTKLLNTPEEAVANLYLALKGSLE